jgi:outer membrane protein assembly factor BamE (lipoprotein component of BamABCDE complex)
MKQIKVGETTKQQVASLLGDPDSQRAIETGGATREWWSYSYASATINPIEYLLVYGFFYNGIGSYDTRHDVDVFFDPHGVVSSLSRMKTDYDMGHPFKSPLVSSILQRTMSFPETAKEPIYFESRMESRY